MNDSPEPQASCDGAMPGWAERLLYRLVPLRNRDIVLGDFTEIYRYIAVSEGRGRALRWYIGQVVKSMPAFLFNGFYFGGAMFGNYIKLAFRNLMKRRFFSALNIGGLVIGMAACLLIFQYVAFERSYDTFHANSEDLYRVILTTFQNEDVQLTGAFTWQKLGETVKAQVPEVAAFTVGHPNYSSATIGVVDVTGARKALREEGVFFADSSFLSVFSFPLMMGDEQAALAEPGSIVITERAAKKYFGDQDPMGKTLEVRSWVDGTFTVRGILQDLPANSHLQFDFLISMTDLLRNDQYAESEGWDWTNFITYVQLSPGASAEAVASKITDVVMSTRKEEFVSSNRRVRMRLQPLESIHLHSDFDEDFGVTGSARIVYFFTIVAFFILVIAWVNYINLTTARAVERAREVGVRKAAGAYKSQVVSQFLLESALTNAVALGLAIAVAVVALPVLNDLAGVEITASVWKNPWLWGSLTLALGVGTLLASLYPAFVLSAFQPAAVLKGGPGTAVARDRLRKGLVVFQFAASIALLTGTFAVDAQVKYLRGLDVGLDLEQVLVIHRPRFIESDSAYVAGREAFKAELSKNPGVEAVATSTSVPGSGFSLGTTGRRASASPTETEEISATWISEDFVDTYGMEVVAGRNLSTGFTTDEDGVLLNETAVRLLGFESNDAAVGEKVFLSRSNELTVVGVLKDYNWLSAKEAIRPVYLLLTRGGSNFSIRVETTRLSETMVAIQNEYNRIFPGNPFDYFFADRNFQEQYKTDQRFGVLFGIFSLFALIVACLGLVGLAAFTASQRTKEIGIRKVLGASAPTIARLVMLDFVKLVALALIFTAPLMYFAVDIWLAGFAARMSLHLWLFILPGLLVMVVALFTMGYHTARIMRTNPVHALRYD